jgi:hypothetical protein
MTRRSPKPVADTAVGGALPICGLATLILVKAVLLAWIGPLTSPDTGGYAEIAEAMRSGVYWGAISLREEAAAPLTMRMAGYPGLLALAEWIAGASAFWVLAALQIGLGILATATLYRFAAALLGNPVAALLVAAAYATGLPLVLDQTILTDGIYASLLVIFLASMGRAAVRRAPLGLARIFVIGMLPTAAFLLREPTIQAMVVMLPAAGAFAFAVRSGVRGRMTAFAALMLPLLIAIAAYSDFNRARTGSAFLTTSVRTALLVPLVQMQAAGAPIFDTSDPLGLALKAEIKEWRNEEIYGAAPRAARQLGMTPVEMADAVREFFLRSVAGHPLAYARHVLSELRFRYFALSVAPAASLGTLAASHEGELVSVSESIPADGLLRLATLLAYGATAALGGICWLAMAAGLPILAATRARSGIHMELGFLLALAAFHLGLMLLFALVHIEARYLIAAQFVPPLALAYMALAIMGRKREG